MGVSPASTTRRRFDCLSTPDIGVNLQVPVAMYQLDGFLIDRAFGLSSGVFEIERACSGSSWGATCSHSKSSSK